MNETTPHEIRWIQCGVVAGMAASVLYPVLLFAPLPLAATAALAALIGPAIGLGSLGLRQLVVLQRQSVAATLGAVSNVVAGALFTTMLLVQLAVRSRVPAATQGTSLVGVWLGLDVAWDAYIGLGTVCFAWSMLRHSRFGRPFAFSGFVLGLAVLVLNLWTFPTPPGEAGSIDIGPFVGLWYFAATLRSWRSVGWARARLGGAA